jgi:holo-[acyl-carrier protein] synthase
MIVGVGIDLVDIPRVERMMRVHGRRALRRLFTDGEIEYARRHADMARHCAARIAAKEATYKALSGTPGARGIAWTDIEVVSQPDGRPVLALHGRAARRAEELGVKRSWVTLTHSDATAGAMVILESA